MKYYCPNCGSELGVSGAFDHDPKCSICGERPMEIIPEPETVGQWEERRGKKYPDTAPVFGKHKTEGKSPQWFCLFNVRISSDMFYKVVATEAGAPPDGWRPE